MRPGIEGEKAPDISSEEFEYLRNVSQEKPKNKHDTQQDISWDELQMRALDWLGEKIFGLYGFRKEESRESGPRVMTHEEVERELDKALRP